MGEKGNLTSEELAASGAVIAGAGTQVTAVFEEAGETLRDKVIDKGADAGIDVATEKWKGRKGDSDQAPPTS